MPKIVWTQDLSVNVTRFDNEHKRLVEMLNKLNESMSQGQGKTVLTSILFELTNYAKTHFKNEEEAMEKCNYPGIVEHKKEHTDFINKVDDMSKQFASGTTSISIQVFNFLLSWVQNHIKTVDKKYSTYL